MLQQQAQKLEYLTHLIGTIFPLHGCWQVAGIHGTLLCLATTEPTAAAQVRYLQQQYLKQIRMFDELRSVTSLKVIVTSPPNFNKPCQPVLKQDMSEDTRQHLREASLMFADNPELSQSLTRIAINWRPKD